LIDGGPRNVYRPHLEPRLRDLRQARRLAGREPLPLDLLMVSHIDDDHIQGLLELTEDLRTAQETNQPPLVQVLSFWHNSFDNIIGNSAEELTAAFRSQFGPASTAGEPPDVMTLDLPVENADEETVVSSLKVLASIDQGAQLRSRALGLGFPTNPEFDGKLIIAEPAGEAKEIGPGLAFTVVGPMKADLEKLGRKHEAWLKDLRRQGKSPPAALAAYVDASVPNLSSLVVLAEAGDQRMLLTGDARGDKILAGLELVGQISPGGTLQVNLLKVPHHGSANNLTQDFFERVTADHYVFSGNGEHGNPERESFEMLLKARGDADYTVHLTYPILEIDRARKADWEIEQAKEQKKRATNPQQRVRPKWSPKAHSLGAFFRQQPDFARKIRIVDEQKPHVIDLLDPLGY